MRIIKWVIGLIVVGVLINFMFTSFVKSSKPSQVAKPPVLPETAEFVRELFLLRVTLFGHDDQDLDLTVGKPHGLEIPGVQDAIELLPREDASDVEGEKTINLAG